LQEIRDLCNKQLEEKIYTDIDLLAARIEWICRHALESYDEE
jgi:hypothetical protein